MDELREKVMKALEISRRTLADRKKDIEGEATIYQLENYIIPELNEILDKISKCEKFEHNYLLSFAYAFKVWCWNMQKPTDLYLLLLEINNSIEKLK